MVEGIATSAGPARRRAGVRAHGPEAEREVAVGRAIVEAATYADVFDWPLTPREVHRYLPVRADVAEVDAALVGPRVRRLVRLTDGYVTLAGREHLVPERSRREAASAALWPRAVRHALAVASLPFVRMVAVTGSLAVGAASDDADVDLFIVTEDGRLWLTRAMTVAVVRAAAVRGVGLCPNYFLAESALELHDRDVFTAHELVQMVPLAGAGAYRALVGQNGWYRDFLPNHPGPPQPARTLQPRAVRRIAERALGAPLLDRVEAWEMDRKIARLSAGPTSGEIRFDRATCKGHVGEHRRHALAAFQERLAWIGEALA